MSSPCDIGILNLTRFGDLIQTTPVLSGLRKAHPEARIHLVIKSRFRAVAELLPCVDEIHEIDGNEIARTLSDPEIPFLDAYTMVRDVVDELGRQHFDVLYNFTHSRSSAVLISLLDADRIVGFAGNRDGQRLVEDPWLRHMATLVRTRRLSHLNLVDTYLGAAGLVGCGERLAVRIPETARAMAETRIEGAGPWLGLQLGASAGNKTWGVERYAQTLSALVRSIPGARVALVGVAAERERADALAERCPDLPICDLVGATAIDELAAVLERLDLLLTNDTGTMHLAGAVGTPTCALFVGPGYPFETAVYAEGHWTLHSRLECAPCGHYASCGNAVCHADVPTDWLAALVVRLLERRDPADLQPLPRADLHRTGFDSDGLLELEPVFRRAPDAQDLMALAYRPAFLESFTGRPARPEVAWRRAEECFGVAPRAWCEVLPADLPEMLREIGRTAARAVETARLLERVPCDATDLRQTGLALQEAEQSIFTLSRAQPLLAPFGYALEEDLLMLPEADLPGLAEAGGSQYRKLERRAAVVSRIVEGQGEPT